MESASQIEGNKNKNKTVQQESDRKHFGESVHGKQVKPEPDTNESMWMLLEAHISMLLQISL